MLNSTETLQGLFMNNDSIFWNHTIIYKEAPLPSIPSATDILLRFEPGSVYIDRIVSPIWYIIGLVGNLISAKVWLGRDNRNKSWTIYLGILAIVHTFLLFIHFFFLELTFTWGIPTNDKPMLCEVLNILSVLPQYLAPLLVLGFTVERYIAVCRPFKKATYCTPRRAIIVISCLTIVSCFFASVQAFFWKYYPEPYQKCYWSTDFLDIQTIWTYVTESIVFLVVPVCVLILNILVIRKIRRSMLKRAILSTKSARSTGGSQTATLLTVSFYFICTMLPVSVVYAIQCQVPRGDVSNIYDIETMATDLGWRKYFRYQAILNVVEEICLSNSACYFFIYYIIDKNFRQKVRNK